MGINATEWLAFSQGGDIAKAKFSAYRLEQEIGDKSAEKAYNEGAYECYTNQLTQAEADKKDEEKALQQTFMDIDETKATAEADIAKTVVDCLSQQIQVNKFAPDQGMNCGMGMGMGDTYTEEGAISLTVEELVALSEVLADFSEDRNQTDNSQQIADHLNNTLSSGAKAVAGTNDDGTKFVEIKRADGSTVKICDANGNGALDVKDYAFCDAIKQAKELVEAMNAKVEQIQKRADAKVEALTKQGETQKENIMNFMTKIDWLENEALPTTQELIEKNSNDINYKNNKLTTCQEAIKQYEKKKEEEENQAKTQDTAQEAPSVNFFSQNDQQNEQKQRVLV